MAKIPPDAFQYYVSLGHARSYAAVAEKYHVTKRAVTKLAARENWQARIHEIESKARRASEAKAVESLEQMNDRHLKSLRVVQGKALETLRSMPLQTAMEAVRALDLAIRQERVVRGEAGDRTATTIEEKIREEYENWLVPEEHDDPHGDTDLDDDETGTTEQSAVLPRPRVPAASRAVGDS